ncbi:MAG: hypothetical protein ACPGNV_03330 [Mangrovicoccus sp.]
MKWMKPLCLLCAALPGQAWGEPAQIKLNQVAPAETACRLTFTAKAETGLSALRLEAVLFDKAGQVMQLSLFDFQDLPAARLRVRQFDIAQTDCADLGQILFNGVERCKTLGGATCDGLPSFGSRAGVEVLG